MKGKIHKDKRKHIQMADTNKKKLSFLVMVHSGMDKISSFAEKIGLVYLITIIALVAGVLLCSYSTLPKDVRDIFTPVIGGLFSLILIPLMLEKEKQAVEQRKKSYETNSSLYKEYAKLAIGICQESDSAIEKCCYHKNLLKKYVSENYIEMSLQFPSDIYWTIHMVDLYLEKEKIDVAKYYAQKGISLMRKQSGLSGAKCDSKRLIEHFSQNGKVKK